uniref:Mitochondrial amidoxime reducing component 2 n=1 Tax=Cacopsylla melanoneura TaxID=428564 RepID=A0A8D8YGD6_9HEMI
MFSKSPPWTSTVLVSAALGLSVTIIWLYTNKIKRRRKNKFTRLNNQATVPHTWTRVGTIKHLYIYPLKSGHYISLERGHCDVQGMKVDTQDSLTVADRSFILFNEKEKIFISSKQFNHLLLVETKYVTNGTYEFSVYNQPSYEKLTININSVLSANSNKTFTLYVDEMLTAFDCGDTAARWFSTYLLDKPDLSIRLGYNSNGRRNVADNYLKKYTTVYDNVNNEDLGVFADMTSYMVLNERSLDDLNDRMKSIGVDDVSMLQFRGNIILDGPEPFAEDAWDWIRFGNDVIMRTVKPCTRCVLTCVHPDTGRKQVDNQPLMTLRQYRAIPDDTQRKVEGFAPMFGVYMGVHCCGYVRVGDDVYVANDK